MAAPYDGRIITYLGAGLASARPAAPNTAPGVLCLWFATDTGAICFWESGVATWSAYFTATTTEAIQDIVDAMTIGGTKITATYDDGLGTLTFDFDGVNATEVPFTPAGSIAATDVAGALAELDSEKMPKAGGTFTGAIAIPADPYDATTWNGNQEAAPKDAVRDKIEAILTSIAGLPTPPNDEYIQDLVAALVVAGTGITVTYNDGVPSLVIACSITQYTDEMVRDVIGTAAVAGAGITIAVNDGADTITITLNLAQANTWTGKQDLTAGGDVTPAATPATNAIGYLGTPVLTSLDSGNVAPALTDCGKTFYHTDANARNFTIPANASVAFPVGTILAIENETGAAAVAIIITSDTLRWGASTGSRSLAAGGGCSIQKVASTVWRLRGEGIT